MISRRNSGIPKVAASAKALAAANILLKVRAGDLDEKQAGALLSGSVGKQWSLITAVQYLSGKEALAALLALPDDYKDGGLTKERLLEAVALANLACANASPAGGVLSAGLNVSKFKLPEPPKRKA